MIFSNISINRWEGGIDSFFRSMFCSGLILVTGIATAENQADLIPSLYGGKDVFEDALEREKTPRPQNRQVTGLTVPHHLLAPDLIARGFYCASGGDYDRIVLLSPDHFRKCRKPFATTTRSFQSVFGAVAPDSAAIRELRKRCDLIERSDLFDEEHGIQAILPFIAHFFPGTKIVPLVIRADSKPEDWRKLVDSLKPLITGKTLIIQSTDFSHYLPEAVATRRDQETINVLSGRKMDDLVGLLQPHHLDALAAQWIHQALQTEVFQAELAIVAHANSNKYTSSRQRETTSYLVQVFEKYASRKSPWPHREGESRYYFAGDTFLGRNFSTLAANPEYAAEVQKRILHLTGGAPLILNLEGVLSPRRLNAPDKNLLVMHDRLALGWLKKLNVRGVSLANNHSYDQKRKGWLYTRDFLSRNQIAVLEDGKVHDFGPFRLAGFTDLSNQLAPHLERLSGEAIHATLRNQDDRPLFCFLHWGREWDKSPSEREEELTRFLLEGGASVIVGCHPHVAGRGIESLRGGGNARIYSMGNFLFDQLSPRSSGAIVEARFFQSGTYALRWIPINNFFESAAP